MRKSPLVAAATAAFLLAAFLTVRPDRAVRIGTGFISHTLCEGAFVSGLDPQRVYAEMIEPVPIIHQLSWALRYEVDAARRQVTTTLAGMFESRAVLRDGLGCLVLHGPDPVPVPSGDVAADAGAAPLPEIGGPVAVEPTEARLRAALDEAFREPDQPPYRQTKAVVIVHDGRIVAERYAPGYGIDTPVWGQSDTKSVTSALIGILVRQGRLSVEEPAPVPLWQLPGDPRRGITIDELLRMTSGLAWQEAISGGGPDSMTRMKYLERDMAGFAERMPLEATPGTAWKYSTGNTMILSRVLADRVGGHAGDALRFAHRELFQPLGMRHVIFGVDAAGTPAGGFGMLAPPRDWARFGVLYADDGVVGGRRILPEGWVRYSASSTPGAWLGYGAGFWTNRGTSAGAQRRVSWGMPADSFFASGSFGQYIVVVPSHRLVVARFGISHGPVDDIPGTARLVKDVIAALDGEPRPHQAGR